MWSIREEKKCGEKQRKVPAYMSTKPFHDSLSIYAMQLILLYILFDLGIFVKNATLEIMSNDRYEQ